MASKHQNVPDQNFEPGNKKQKPQSSMTVNTPKYFRLIDQPEGKNELFKIPETPLGSATKKMAQMRDAEKEIKKFKRDAEIKFIQEIRKTKQHTISIELGNRVRRYVVKQQPEREVVVEEK